jgi:hypothetical protein
VVQTDDISIEDDDYEVSDVTDAGVKLLCERSLYDFAKEAWPIVEPVASYVDNWHIEATHETPTVSRGAARHPRRPDHGLPDVFQRCVSASAC